MSDRISHEVADVLAGRRAYDGASNQAQTLVRDAWTELIDRDIAAIDLVADFKREGRTRWSEADTRGASTVTDLAAHSGRGSRTTKMATCQRAPTHA